MSLISERAVVGPQDDKVVEFNEIASAVTYTWDLEINNNDLTPDKDIISAIQSINAVEGE